MYVCSFKNVKVSKTDEIGAAAKQVFNQIKKCWEKTCYRPILMVGLVGVLNIYHHVTY